MEKKEYNEDFEMIYLIKRKEDILTDEELIVYTYMFKLRINKLDMEEKQKLQKKTEELIKLLDRVYENL
jgi:hypothetical protein